MLSYFHGMLLAKSATIVLKKSSFESAVGWVYFPHLQNKNWKDNFFPVVWWWQIRGDLWIEVYYFERPFDGTVSGPNRLSFPFAISPGDLGRGFRPRFRLGNHSNVGVTYSTPLDHFVVYHFIVCWYSNERTIYFVAVTQKDFVFEIKGIRTMLFIELCICWEHLRLTDKNKITMSFVFYPDNFVDEGFLSSVLQRDRSNRTIRLCGAFFSFETTWTVFVQCCIRHAYYCLLSNECFWGSIF